MRVFEAWVTDTSRSLKVTLVWTDAPSLEGAGGLENQLYLQVRHPDGVPAYYLVELVGPAKEEWLNTIRAHGGIIHSNLASFTLLVGILPAEVPTLQEQPWVEAITPYRAAMKVSPKLRPGVGRHLGAAELETLDLESEAPDTREQVEKRFPR